MEKFYEKSKISIFGVSNFSSTSSSSTSNEDDYFEEDKSSELDCIRVQEEDSITAVLKHEAYCFDIRKFSEKFVNAISLEAVKDLNKRRKNVTALDIIHPLIQDLIVTVITFVSETEMSQSISSSHPYPKSSPSVNRYEEPVEWPKISEFNIKLGLEKIEEYVATWKRSKDWLFCVEFLGFESEDCSNIFVYEVEWSKPTKTYPIPQATASVYFALEVTKMVPYNHDRSIEVTYVFESSNVIHAPGKINFQEKWLSTIIESKLKIFKSLTFSVAQGICSIPEIGSDSESITWK